MHKLLVLDMQVILQHQEQPVVVVLTLFMLTLAEQQEQIMVSTVR